MRAWFSIDTAPRRREELLDAGSSPRCPASRRRGTRSRACGRAALPSASCVLPRLRAGARPRGRRSCPSPCRGRAPPTRVPYGRAVLDLVLAPRAVDELSRGRALRAQPAARDRRVGVALDLDDPLVLDVDVLAAARPRSRGRPTARPGRPSPCGPQRSDRFERAAGPSPSGSRRAAGSVAEAGPRRMHIGPALDEVGVVRPLTVEDESVRGGGHLITTALARPAHWSAARAGRSAALDRGPRGSGAQRREHGVLAGPPRAANASPVYPSGDRRSLILDECLGDRLRVGRSAGRLSHGLAAGAVGTTLLNAVTYLDMAIRARPASSIPEQDVEVMAERAGISLGDAEGAATRKSAIGALMGLLTGVTAGAVFGLVRPLAPGAHRWPPWRSDSGRWPSPTRPVRDSEPPTRDRGDRATGRWTSCRTSPSGRALL